jgi:hypothetical protein
MDALKEIQGSDAVLSDLDSRDLVRAGLMSESNAKSVKKQIRLATIGRSYVTTTGLLSLTIHRQLSRRRKRYRHRIID